MNPNPLTDLTQDENQRRTQGIDLSPVADVVTLWPAETASAIVEGAGSVAEGALEAAGSVAEGALEAAGSVAEGALEAVGAILSGIFSS
jgi:hypothetical protein